MNVGTLTISLAARTAALLSSLSKVRTFERGVMASVQRINRSVGTLGQSLSILSLPLVAVTALAVRQFAQFEFSLAKTTGLAGVAAKQVQAWTANVLELSERTGKSANELAEALYFVASSGIKGAKVLEVLEVAAYGAMAGLGETKDIANLLTSVMNAYGVANTNVAGTMDTLVAAVREGKAEADDMAKSLGMVVNVASELGISFANVASAVAATTRTGVSTQTSATQLRQFLFSFVKERPMVEEALESMGLTFKEVRKNLSDDLLTGLIKLRAVTSAWGDSALAKVIPRVRAFNEALSLTGVNVISTMRLFREVQNPTNAFATAIDAVDNTAKVRFDQALQKMNNRLIMFGSTIIDDVMPIVQKFTDLISNVVSWFTSLDSKTQSMIVTITALSAVFGPLLLAVSSLGTLVLTIVSALSAVISPILLIVGAVAALGAAIIWVQNNWTLITVAASKTYDQIELATLHLINWLREKWTKFIDWFGSDSGFGKLGSLVTRWNKWLLEDFYNVSKENGMTESIKETEAEILALENKIADSTNYILSWSDVWEEAVSDIKGTFSKGFNWIVDMLPDIDLNQIFKNGGGVTVPALNIGGGGDLGYGFLKYVTEANEYLETKKKIEAIIKEQGGITAAFGEVPGITEDTPMAKAIELITDHFRVLNKEVSNLIEHKGDLAGFMSSMPEGFKALMNPEDLATLNKYIQLYQEEVAKAAARVRELTNMNWDFTAMGEKVLDMVNQLADAFATLNTKMDLSGNRETGAFNTGKLDAQLEYWQSVQSAIIAGQSELMKVNKDYKIPQDVMDSWIQAGTHIDELTLKITRQQAVAQAMVSGIQSLGTAIGEAFAGSEDAFKNFATALLQSAGSIIGSLLGIALAAETVKKGLVVGLIVGLIGVSAVLAAINATKEKAANLASGGIIPPGYPNDSFNANLSSNEAVIPLERLPQLIGIGRSSNKQIVEFKIEGRDLLAILQDASVINNLK